MRKETDKEEVVKEIAETVSSSEEEEGPPLAASTALPGSPTASASTPPPGSPATPATPTPPGVPATSTMTVTAFWKNNICQAVNFFVKAWGNTKKATVRHAWSALLPQLKSAETKRQQPAELMNQVLETVRSIPTPGFQEVTREDLEELMQEGNTNDVEDLLEDEEGESGDAASDAGETEQRKATTQKLSL
ncbi:hypothetical protein Hamer_G014477 [Homarus americanus]|uniref:Uncharacterized protein n=1 Tax=Homarus americanus TaxID=6706 RepID=A0A8J5JTW5_HOMAM|nr:hypothetical protein Hamer_G014477 [Homarus americanus]